MTAPTKLDLRKLKRLVRYYAGMPRTAWRFDYAEVQPDQMIRVFSDSDWAGDSESRKSTSAGMVFYGHALVEAFASSQQIVALSSAEAEYVAMVKAAAHGLELSSTLAVSADDSRPTVHLFSDSKAARAVSCRRGIGRIKHLAIRFLWLQEMTASGEIAVHTVSTTANPADLGTKPLDARRIVELLRLLPYGRVGGKH